MSENGNGKGATLDLDALYGRAEEPLTITWGGRTYELLRPQALSPRELVLLGALQKRIDALQALEQATSLTQAQSDELADFVRDVLGVICPSLKDAGKDMPFMARMNALLFYKEETSEKKIVTRPPRKGTLAKRSRR